jgi:hypothetical protein
LTLGSVGLPPHAIVRRIAAQRTGIKSFIVTFYFFEAQALCKIGNTIFP